MLCLTTRVPEKSLDYYVNNTLDQLVATQDGNGRNGRNRWLYTKYDALGRVIS